MTDEHKGMLKAWTTMIQNGVLVGGQHIVVTVEDTNNLHAAIARTPPPTEVETEQLASALDDPKVQAKVAVAIGEAVSYQGFELSNDPRPAGATMTTQSPEPTEQVERWEVRPCVDKQGNVTSYDICLPSEPDATGVAVIASIYSGKEVADDIVFAHNTPLRRAALREMVRLDEEMEAETEQRPEPTSDVGMHDHECPRCHKPFSSESAPNFCPYGCGALSSNSGYVEAFYELADMMGIVAQPRSPKDVWEREMKPRLALAIAASAPDVPRLRSALAPFAKVAEGYLYAGDDADLCDATAEICVKVGDLLNARAAITAMQAASIPTDSAGKQKT